jgi:outer membrane protein
MRNLFSYGLLTPVFAAGLLSLVATTNAAAETLADTRSADATAGIVAVYRAAQAGDPVLRQAAALRQARQEAEPQARALLLPSVGAAANLNQTFLNNPTTPGGDSSLTGHSIGVNLIQPLYNRGSQVRQRQADVVVQQADTDFTSAEQLLILRVAQRYFEMLSGQDDVKFIRADKAAIERQLEQAKERFDVGLVTITDVQEAQARFDQSTAEEISVLNILADRKEALREITGQYFEQLQPLLDNVPLKTPDPADPEVWVNRALRNNPDLQSASFNTEIARENIELQRSGYYPTLDLTAGVGESDNGNNDNSSAQIGLQFNMPLYTGGAVSSRVREAAFQHEAAKEQREQVQRAIMRQVQDAYRGAQTAISRVKALNQARVSSRSSLEATQVGFDVGTRTIVDVLNAQRELLRAERDYSQSRYAYILNRLILEQAVGELGEEDLAAIENWLGTP